MNAKNEDVEILQKDLLELSIKSGRRLLHDFDHLLSELPKDHFFKDDFKERSKIWHSVFYPDNGMKNYLTQMHYDIRFLEIKLRSAEEKLKKHGIDNINPDLPY